MIRKEKDKLEHELSEYSPDMKGWDQSASWTEACIACAMALPASGRGGMSGASLIDSLPIEPEMQAKQPPMRVQ